MSAQILVDTSVAVPLVVGDHERHEQVTARVANHAVGLSGHAAIETFSVLTRLPAPWRRDPATVARIITTGFPATVFLSPDQTTAFLADLQIVPISGGSVYDGLVGAAARAARLLLLSADRRAASVYELLNVEFELIE